MPSARKPGGTRPARTKKERGPVSKKRPSRRSTAGGSTAASSSAAPAQAGTRPAEAQPVAATEGKTPGARRAAGKTIVIEQYGSGIGCPFRQKRILRSLGLRHPRQRVLRPDNPAVRGMVNAIPHLVRIVEADRAA